MIVKIGLIGATVADKCFPYPINISMGTDLLDC